LILGCVARGFHAKMEERADSDPLDIASPWEVVLQRFLQGTVTSSLAWLPFPVSVVHLGDTTIASSTRRIVSTVGATLACDCVEAAATSILAPLALTDNISALETLKASRTFIITIGDSHHSAMSTSKEYFLSHRYDGSSMALRSTAAAVAASPKLAVEKIDVFVWAHCHSEPLVSAMNRRVTWMLAGGPTPSPCEPTKVAQVLLTFVPRLQRGLSCRRSPYLVALLTPDSGLGISGSDEDLEVAAGGSVEIARPPIGFPFGGCGPALLFELTLGLFAVSAFGSSSVSLLSVGELSDAPEVADAVMDQLRSAFDSVAGLDHWRLVMSAVVNNLALRFVESPRCLSDLALSRLLRLRLTLGSKAAVEKGIAPVPLASLIAAFDRPHEYGQAMSVGARALAKHHHRDTTTSWWLNGAFKGSQADKNAQALGALARVLRDCSWANVHLLPHDIVTYELRCEAGYGARWVIIPQPVESSSVDGEVAEVASGEVFTTVEFRGFLEPHDEEGHAKGWRH
jgi:hypothetical protein